MSDYRNPHDVPELPQLTVEEGSWLAGVTPEAFVRFLEESNAVVRKGRPMRIGVTEMVRAAFSLLQRRESQLAMLRLQLTGDAPPEEQELAPEPPARPREIPQVWEEPVEEEERTPRPVAKGKAAQGGKVAKIAKEVERPVKASQAPSKAPTKAAGGKGKAVPVKKKKK
ncbi:MAG: hypothetical protein HQL51_14690 [Magnetococcales bacterium]|nr:hypothetical protein [Magnetococcales bacterium]